MEGFHVHEQNGERSNHVSRYGEVEDDDDDESMYSQL
jgi:hypothetical protein